MAYWVTDVKSRIEHELELLWLGFLLSQNGCLRKVLRVIHVDEWSAIGTILKHLLTLGFLCFPEMLLSSIWIDVESKSESTYAGLRVSWLGMHPNNLVWLVIFPWVESFDYCYIIRENGGVLCYRNAWWQIAWAIGCIGWYLWSSGLHLLIIEVH